MQLYQASTSRNWWGLWPRFCKQGTEALTHLSVLTGTLNSDDWLCKAKVTGLTSLAKSLLMSMCLVPGLWWASFCKRQGHSCSWRNPVLHRYSRGRAPGVVRSWSKWHLKGRLVWPGEVSGMGETHFRLPQSWEWLREEVDWFFPGVPSERSKGNNNKLHQGIICWAKGRSSPGGCPALARAVHGSWGIFKVLNFRTHWEIQ